MERAKDLNFNPFGNAPTVIRITGDKSARFVEIDCSLATENILKSLGFGSHIMTMTELMFASEEGRKMKEKLGIPEKYEHICTIALGYKDEVPPIKPERRDLINIIG